MAGRLLAFYGVHKNKKLTRYINTIGSLVAQSSKYPDRLFHFAILDTESVVAFSSPGGYIMISRGVIRFAKNEAEIAGILSHEIAHVGEQHILKTLTHMDEKEITSLNKSTLVKKQDVRLRVSSEEDSYFANYLAKAKGVSNIGVTLFKASKAGISIILEKGLDHQYEYEADHEGTRFAMLAGYDPKGLYHFLDRLGKSKNMNMGVISKTHPSIHNRKKRIMKFLEKPSNHQVLGALREKRFLRFQTMLEKKPKK